MKYKKLLCAVCALLCVVFAFALVGCGNDAPHDQAPQPETVRVKYLPISEEETFKGYHWIRYATYHENEKFGILSNTQIANVTQQTFKQDDDGSFIVDYSCPEIYQPTMHGFDERTIYKNANIFYDGYYNADFAGCVYEYDDASCMARAYVNWKVEFIGTDWLLYQPILHTYRIYYTYIERNEDETITFYRCTFTHQVYWSEDWLAEYAINYDKIPTYAPPVDESTKLKLVLDSTGEVVITDANLANVEIGYDNINGYVVALTLDKYGTKRFGEISSKYVGETISIVTIDENKNETIISSPTINSAVTDGKVVIILSGDYESANTLYNQIVGSV